MENRWIWPFELEEKIGEGGMGLVYRARYVKDDRRFAVKLLPLDLDDQTILARFGREMDVLKTLKHPHIVRCFGGVCGDKQRFYAMELVENGTLAGVIREYERVPWNQVVEYAIQICKALEYAHSKGVVHRDVKPANFLMTNTGKLKLSDFGLISIAATSRLTTAGKTMGTIPYMAPEQIRGKPPASPQTDLYALGCVMFEMLTGNPPFKGETPAETMHQHLEVTPPRISKLIRDCPKSLEKLIYQLLEKNPEDRPISAVEVAARLEDIWQDAALGAETMDAAIIEPSDTGPAIRERIAAKTGDGHMQWLIGLCLLAIAALLVWNLILLGNARQQSRAEQLWAESMESETAELRVAAARALAEIGPDPERNVQLLLRGLNDSHGDVRAASAQSLGKLGSVAKEAIPTLTRLQSADENTQVRTQAAAALETLKEAPSEGSNTIYWVLAFIAAAVGVGGYFAVKRSLPKT